MAAILTFLSSPPGLVVSAIFGVEAFATMKTLYQNKKLPLAVAAVGREFKARWEKVEGNEKEVDLLRDKAANCLIYKAKIAQIELFKEVEHKFPELP